MELTRRFPDDLLARALSDWAWLPDLHDKAPLAASAFGDLFLHGPDGVWFLDLVEGALTREWDDVDALEGALNTREGQDRFLLAGLVVAAHEAGLEPGPSEVLAFAVPPVLGGALEPSNVQVNDLEVALSITGQLHQQVRAMAPGTQITGVTLED